MNIETKELNDKPNAPVIGVYDIKLKVGDGIRFGFGFGFGVFVWGLLLSVVIFCAVYFAATSFIETTMDEMMGINPFSQSIVNNQGLAEQMLKNTDLNNIDLNKIDPKQLEQYKKLLSK